MLKLNRKMADDADVRQMYDDLANAGDDCVHFPLSSDGCGASECSKGTQHHTTCNWNSVPATVSGTAAPYTIKANGVVAGSSSGCVTANSCVMGMFETTKYSSLCQGDTIEAIYSAAQGGDWFEVAMGLYEGTPGYNPTFVEKMIYRGSAVSNAVAKFTIPRNGDFFVRIFGASYDRTGGTVLGATLTLESEFEVVGACSVNGVTQQNANPPTPWPTPGPASSPAAAPAAATGDPHLTDMNGEKFDIAETSQMDFDHVALVQPHASVNTSGAHYYVCVGTADKWGAGTDQNCYAQLRGAGGSSEHKHLDHSGIWWNDHRRGSEDCYVVTAPEGNIDPSEACLEHKGTWYDHWSVAYVDVWHGWSKSGPKARANFGGKWLADDEDCQKFY